MEHDGEDARDVNHPYFSVVVEIPRHNFITAKIPTGFIWRHMGGRYGRLNGVRLVGLKEVYYTVGLTFEEGELFFDVGWTRFLQSIRDGRLKMVLVFQKIGPVHFAVQRFDERGTCLRRNPIPPEGYNLDPDGTLDLKYHSTVRNKVAPVITDSPFALALKSDGAPCAAVLYWESRKGLVEWPVLLNTFPTGVSFGLGWPRFAADNRLQDGRLCVLTYKGNMKFSVLVFHRDRGTLEMKYHQIETAHLVPPPSTPTQEAEAVGDDVDNNVVVAGAPSEPVMPNFARYEGFYVRINRGCGSFFAQDAHRIFPPEGDIWITLQRSDGAVWPVKVILSNKARLMSEGYSMFRRMNDLALGQLLVLHQVEPRRFVFG